MTGTKNSPHTEAKPTEAKPAEAKPAPKSAEGKAADAKPTEAKPTDAKPVEAKPAPKPEPVEAKPVEAKPAEAKPAPKPEPVVFTIPDAVPEAIDVDVLEDPLTLEAGDPDAVMPPPGVAPPGDARSLRGLGPDRTPMFALVYRVGTALVVAEGRVGRRGTWRATEYPNAAAASHAYANACGRFTQSGYIDFRR